MASIRGQAGCASVLAIALVLTACSTAGGGGANEGSTTGTETSEPSGGTDTNGGDEETSIAVAATGLPSNMDVHMAGEPEYSVTWRIFESLVDFDPTGEVIPVLATDIPEMQEDGTTWRVNLREGVTFHNGDPFDADDVVHSVERITDPDFGTTLIEVAGIVGAEKVDDYTVDILTASPDPMVFRRLVMLKIMSDSVPEPDFASSDALVGTGPYRIVDYEAGDDRAIIEANPDYWGGELEIDRVEIRFIPDPATRASALQAGEVDIVVSLEPEFADAVPQIGSTEGGVSTGVVRINTNRPPFDDPRVRLALNHAIDKDALAELFAGFADPANCQMTPPQAFGTNPDLEPIPYDPERAMSLLEEAGAAGVSVTLRWSTGVFPKDREQGELVAQMLRDVGLDVDLTLEEFDRWLNTGILVTGEEADELVWTESSNDLNDADRQMDQYYASGDSPVSTSTTEFDATLEAAQAELDLDRRQELFEEVATLGCESPPVIFLLFRRDLYGFSERLQYQPHADIGAKLYYDEMSVTG